MPQPLNNKSVEIDTGFTPTKSTRRYKRIAIGTPKGVLKAPRMLHFHLPRLGNLRIPNFTVSRDCKFPRDSQGSEGSPDFQNKPRVPRDSEVSE